MSFIKGVEQVALHVCILVNFTKINACLVSLSYVCERHHLYHFITYSILNQILNIIHLIVFLLLFFWFVLFYFLFLLFFCYLFDLIKN